MRLKKILYILLSIFLIYVTYSNLLYINNSSATLSVLKAILFGVYFTFCVTGIFAFSGFALPTYTLLPDSYYKIRNLTFLKKVYSILGVHYFAKAVVALFYNKKKIKATYFNGNSETITAFIKQTKQDEFGHIVPFVLISFYCLFIHFSSNNILVLSIFISNVLLNFYPVIMQRHHRTYRSKI